MLRGIFTTTLFIILSMPMAAVADNHYSFEDTERLTTLIEWREYGPKAFAEAATENKPIFLLLTAPSWCYWCQVYESQEYLFNPDIVSLINTQFIPIYVDADRRQDLTRQYLEGGWPSTTIMAPNRERLFGFSGPRPVPWMLENLRNVAERVKNTGFATALTPITYTPTPPHVPTESELRSLVAFYLENSASIFDPLYGGFGEGMKFPQPRTLMAFLEKFAETKEERWLSMVEKTLENEYTSVEKIETDYNLFDPIEGGFHRYGTRRDYTPPHYEKMLYDNAKLLQLYSRLADLNGNPLAKEVSEKTFAFLQTWFDGARGGFAGNSDAFDEDEYYGKRERPAEKPRIEATKYTDWNSDMMIALFDIGKRRNDRETLAMGQKSLTFFLKEMLDDDGPYHFMSPDGLKDVQGDLIDSSHLLLASIEGYRALKNPLFLSGALHIANFALKNLYDWNSGGFFERNSQNTDLYAPEELLLTEKPAEENGMMAYAFLLLFEQTKELRFLNAAVKTMGQFVNSVPSLDNDYFLYKAAKEILEQGDLSSYQNTQEEIQKIDQQGQASFFLNQPNKPTFIPTPSESPLSQISFFILTIVALLAGLLSFLSPCTLPILPAYLAMSLKAERGKQFLMSLSFFAGLAFLFTLLGISATAIGSLLRTSLPLLTQLTGILLIVFGGMTLLGKGFGGVILSPVILSSSKDEGQYCMTRSFLLGGTLGIAWTPCTGPILASLLALAGTLESSFQGGLLLFLYALGLGLPLLLLSSSLDHFSKNGKLWKVLRGRAFTLPFGSHTFHLHSTSVASGLLLISMGILIASGNLTIFNRLVTNTALQKIIFGAEEFLLNFLK